MNKDDLRDKLFADFASSKGRQPDKHEAINLLTTESRLNTLYNLLRKLTDRVIDLENK